MKHFIRLIYCCCLLSVALPANAQKATLLTVVDQAEKKPLIGAHVCLVSTSGKKSYHATDAKGQIAFTFTEPLEGIITYMGFHSQTINFHNHQNQTVVLRSDLLMLDQVIKTATIEPQKIDQSIYKIGIINAATIEKQGVQNLTDALRFQPNINLTQDAILGSQIVMQGLEGKYVKVLVDGIPVIGRQDGNIDLSQIDMTQVDHIEIIEGPMSVVYGSNALAGTINIITKENKHYAFNGSAKIYAESIGQLNGNINLSGNIKKHRYGISGGYRYFNGVDLEKTTRAMNWNPKDQGNFEAYYGYNNKGWETKLGYRKALEMLLYKGNYLAPTSPKAYDSKFITERNTTYADIKKHLAQKEVISLLASYSIYHRVSNQYYTDVYEKTELLTNTSSDRFETSNSRIGYAKTFNKDIDWQLGHEFNYEVGQGAKITHNDGLMENAVWTDIKLPITRQLTFQPGLRYIHHNVYQAPLIYTAHLSWKPTTEWQGKFSFGKGFKAPSLKELYLDFNDSNHKIFGNPNLNPETSYSTTASIAKRVNLTDNKMVKIEASGFYNHLNDVIEILQGEDSISYYYKNIAEKKTHGGNVSINLNLKNRFKVNIGTTITGIGYDPLEISKINYQYSNDWTAMISYFFPHLDLSMQVDYKYTDKRVQLFAYNDPTQEEIQIREGSIDGYQMLNASIGKKLFHQKLLFNAGVKNILDITSVTANTQGSAHSSGTGTMIAWGRSYFLSCTYYLKKR